MATFNRDDLVVRGGAVCTMAADRPWADCVVVRDGVIAYVGDESGARDHAGPAAHVLDLDGGVCLPGFIDAHDHFATMAITKLGVSVAGVVGRDRIVDLIRRHAAAEPGDGLLRGYGWMPDSFEEGGPRREWLDEATGDRPMILFSADSHDLWFNTAAMRAASVSAATADPSPGTQYFHRDPDGTPTGWAVEGAQVLLTVPLGVYARDGVRQSQALTLDQAPSWGITAYLEAGAIVGPRSSDSEPVYLDLIERDESGGLPLRVVGTVWTRNADDDARQVAEELRDWNRRLRSPHVQVSVCKMWSDGVLMSGGALLLDDFCHRPGERGRMSVPFDQIVAVTEQVQLAGFDMHVHVDGDGSVRTVLDAFAEVQRRHGAAGARHAIAHNSLVAPEDVPRYRAMGVIANCTPLWGTDYNGQYVDIYTDLLGAQRMEERLFPYGDLVRSGAVVTYGADIPGVDVDEIAPLIQIEAAVTRRRPGHPDDRPLVERQRVDVMDALRCSTVNAAHQLRMEDRVGSIAVGRQADLVLLGANPFTVPVDQIHAIPVRATVMDGMVTHLQQ